MANHYKTLGVEKSATSAQIDEAFLRIKKKVMDAGSNSHEIDLAYSVLANASDRKAYDDALGNDAGSTKAGASTSRRKLFACITLGVFVSVVLITIYHRGAASANAEAMSTSTAAPASPPPVLEASVENPDRWIDIGQGPKNSEIKYRSVNLKGLPSTISSDLMELKLAAQDDPNMNAWAQLDISYCDLPALVSGALLAACHLGNSDGSIIAITADSEARRKLLGAITEEAFTEGKANGRGKAIALKGVVTYNPSASTTGSIVITYK